MQAMKCVTEWKIQDVLNFYKFLFLSLCILFGTTIMCFDNFLVILLTRIKNLNIKTS